VNRMIICSVIGVAACIGLGCAGHDKPGESDSPAPQAADAQAPTGDGYYLPACARCDRLLGSRGDVIDAVADRRRVRFCCADCRNEFFRDTAAGLAGLDRRLIEDQASWYPTDTSIVSGRPLGATPVNVIWGNRLVRVTDASEAAAFRADPQPYIEQLDRLVIARQAPLYVIRKCPVQGTRLDDEVEASLTAVVAGRMIRVCCMDCRQRVLQQPGHYLPLIDFALREELHRQSPDRRG